LIVAVNSVGVEPKSLSVLGWWLGGTCQLLRTFSELSVSTSAMASGSGLPHDAALPVAN
jgi:hypothetical protein